MRDGFVFYESFYEAMKDLPADDMKDLMMALCEYALFGKEPEEMTGLVRLGFTLIRPQIDANERRRENGKKGAEFGGLGGRPRKPQENPYETPNKPLENPKETPRKPLENPKQTPNKPLKGKGKGKREMENGKDKEKGEMEKVKVSDGADAPSPARPSLAIKLRDGTEWDPTGEDIEALQKDFPKIDVVKELSFMAAWAEKTPEKRPSAKSVIGAVRSWMGRESETARSGTKKTTYKDFPQREYTPSEIEDMERQLWKEAQA